MGSPRSPLKTIGHRNNSRHNQPHGRNAGNLLLSVVALFVVGSLYLLIFADSGNVYGGDATKHLKTLGNISKDRANGAGGFSPPILANTPGALRGSSPDEEESDPQDRDASDENQDSEEESDHHDIEFAFKSDEQNNSEENSGDSSNEENGNPNDPEEVNGDPDESDTSSEANNSGDQDQDSVSDEETGDAGQGALGEDQDGDSDSGEGNDSEELGEDVARR
jgi:hypothetical protein